MHSIHILILIIGIVVPLILARVYCVNRGVFGKSETVVALLLGLFLGLAALGALHKNYFMYAILIAGYISYFHYLKINFEFNKDIESTFVSLVVGVVIGLFGLVGCLVCSMQI